MHCEHTLRCIHPGPRNTRKRSLAAKGGYSLAQLLGRLRPRPYGFRLSPGINSHPSLPSASPFLPGLIATKAGKEGPHLTSGVKNHMALCQPLPGKPPLSGLGSDQAGLSCAPHTEVERLIPGALGRQAPVLIDLPPGDLPIPRAHRYRLRLRRLERCPGKGESSRDDRLLAPC